MALFLNSRVTLSYFQYREVVRSSLLIMARDMNLDENTGKCGLPEGGCFDWMLQSRAWSGCPGLTHPTLGVYSGACSSPKLSGMSLLGTSWIKDTTGTLSCYVMEALSVLLQLLCETFLAHHVARAFFYLLTPVPATIMHNSNKPKLFVYKHETKWL